MAGKEREIPVCNIEGCPFRDQIEATYEKVILGNGKESLVTRMDQVEKTVDRLVTLVKGDKEGEGLQTHMIELRTGLRFVTWLLITGISVGLLVCALLGIWMKHYSESHTPVTHHSDIPTYAFRR